MHVHRVFAAVVLAVAATLAIVTWTLTRNGLSARAGLSPPEDRVLEFVRLTAIRAGASSRTNPLPGGTAWRDAAGEFQEHCEVCHGETGRGDGPLGEKMYPPAANLTLPSVQHLSDGELYHIVSEGIRLTGMPAMGGHESSEDIWKMVALIRHLPGTSADEMRRFESTASAEATGTD